MDKFCAKHETPYFKKGRMKNYAHPIEGTEPTEWCNAPEQDMSAMEESAEVGHLVEAAVKQGAKVEAIVNKPSKDDKIDRAVAFKGAIECATADVIKLSEVGAYTEVFVSILKGK